MKRISITCLFILFLLGGNSGFAQEQSLEEVLAGEENFHTWDLGTEISYITYKEPAYMKNRGMMYGIIGSYAYHQGLMFKVEGKVSGGQVDYTSSDTGEMDNLNDYMFEFRGMGGYDFLIGQTMVINPYAGLGYRYLNDDSAGMTTTTGAVGYERESNYFYSPIGVAATMDFDNGWSCGLSVEYDLFWQGVQKSYLSDANLNFNDVENDQEEGYGCRASLQLKKKGQKFSFLLEPFVRYWKISDSEESLVTYAGVIYGYGYEPKNESLEAGIKISTQF